MITVKTQAEFGSALAAGETYIFIDSPAGVWIQVSNTGNATVRAWGNATVEAWDNATVEASGNATVRAWGNATVEAWGNATVEAWDNATVEAWDNATVEASGNATVEASGNAGVHAHHRSQVKAGKCVAVHLHDATATVEGGVVIDVSKPLTDPADWCDYHGVEVKRGIATVYKAVNDAYTTDRGTDYSPGAKPAATDWRADGECGGGLHFSPTPAMARDYYPRATKFLAVGVRVKDLQPILEGGTPKCKAPAVVRACVEVDRRGEAVQS